MDPEIIPIKKEELNTPFFNTNKSPKALPINFTNANFFSKFFYLWVKPAIDLSMKRPLNISDVGNISKEQITCENMSLYQIHMVLHQ